MKVTPFEVYTTYLGMKNHFTKDKYDFVKYSGKTRASVASFNNCLLYTSPSPRDVEEYRMPSSA